VMRLKAKGSLLAFRRWAEAAAEQREERAAAEANSLASFREASILTKFQKINRGLFFRGFRICSLTCRRSMRFLLCRVLKKWRLHVRLEQALFIRGSCQSLRYFCLWREVIPELRRIKLHEGSVLVKKVVLNKVWR
jgi:hypothetical protein